MREGYDRVASNNVIINNSLHPHVWYPNSGDKFEHNIVFGAYKPAIMGRAIASEGKWGAQLDSNLFATNDEDRARFRLNGCDTHSLVGDPMFLDAANGDFRVRNGSPALLIGFVNFPMNMFGVTSERLRKIAKRPVVPALSTNPKETSGKVFKWEDATFKNVETAGEQSAAGLPEISGVIVLSLPAGSKLAISDLKVGDVILQCGGKQIANFSQLLQAVKEYQLSGKPDLVVQRNQSRKTISLPLK
jgi:hypothetical protein